MRRRQLCFCFIVLANLVCFAFSACDPSCLECSSSGLCTKCISEMYLNSTTHLCQFCSYASYYNPTTKQCESCGSSCSGSCAYQTSCFKCNGTQVFNLNQMECVDSCGSTEFVLQSSSINRLSVCRNQTYYVNPNSQSSIELGTQDYPYRSINCVFIELFNLVSGLGQDIIVNLSKSSTHYLSQGSIIVNDIKSLSLVPYDINANNSTNGYNYLTRIQLVVSDNVTMSSAKTRFILLSDLNYNSTKINNFNFDSLKVHDRSMISLMIIKSSLSISSAKLSYSFTTLSGQNTILFHPIELNQHTLGLFNVDLNAHGTILKSNYPLQITSTNVTVYNYNQNYAGFILEVDCSASDSAKTGEIVFENLSFTTTSSDNDKIRQDSFFRSNTPANVTFKNSHISIHYDDSEIFDLFYFEDKTICAPNDNVSQYITFENNIFSFNVLDTGVHNNLYISLSGLNKRNQIVNIVNNTLMNMWYSDRAYIYVNLNTNGKVNIDGNYIFNCTASEYLFQVSSLNDMTIQNMKFDKCIAIQSGFLKTNGAPQINLYNFTLSNTTFVETTQHDALITLKSGDNSIVILDELYFTNNSPLDSWIYFEDTIGNITIINCVFTYEVIRTGAQYMLIANPNTFLLSNFTFENLSQDYLADEETALIRIQSLDVSSGGNFTIKDGSMKNSSVSFSSFQGFSGESNLTKFLLYDNILIQDCTMLEFCFDMVNFDVMLSTQDAGIVVNNSVFENIYFVKPTHMFHNNQNLLKPFYILNSKFNNITGGTIMMQPAYVYDTAPYQTIIADNLTVSNNDFREATLFTMDEHTILYASNIAFYRNSAYFYGTFISIINSDATAIISNSTFSNNNGVSGGIFYCNGNSDISVTNSIFFNNYAISSTISYGIDQATINFNNCIFNFNHANNNLLFEITDSNSENILENSVIYDNKIVSNQEIFNDLTNDSECKYLCFASDTYTNYLIDNSYLFSTDIVYSISSSIESIVTFRNTSFYNMDGVSIMYSYNSNFNIEDCTFYNITMQSDAIVALATNLNISNLTMTTISAAESANYLLINMDLSSVAIISNSIFQNMSVAILNCFDSEVNIVNSTYSYIVSNQYIFNFYQCYNIKFEQSKFTGCTTTQHIGIVIYRDSTIDYIKNSMFTNSQLITFVFISSNLTSFDNNTMSGVNKGIKFSNNCNATITNSNFINFVQNQSFINRNLRRAATSTVYISNIVSDGSAIEIVDSNVKIRNSIFKNNIAQNGGAISINCNYLVPCYNEISNCTFQNNTSLKTGSAIKYNSYEPDLLGNVFANNTAGVGSSIGDYAGRIKNYTDSKIQSIATLSNIPSGQELDFDIPLCIVNTDETQVMTSVNSGVIQISAIDSSSKIRGQNTVGIINGVGTFTSTIFKDIPGRSNVKFSLYSSAINYKLTQYLDPVKYATQVIVVNFRWCMPGEIEQDNTCLVCAQGTYSVVWNATECISCPDNAICAGKSISLDSGYWRKDQNTTDIVECPNTIACLGGYNETSQYPVNCAEGYQGVLCNECVSDENNKYERITENTCSKCPNSFSNIIRLIMVSIVIIVFLALLIKVNIQKKEDSNISVCMRIMTNYLQMISACLAFNLKFPNYFTSMINGAKSASGSSDVAVSLDCFLKDTHVNKMFDNIAFLKIVLISLIPVILILSVLIIFAIMFLKDRNKFKRYLSVSVITIFFLFHPTLTQYCLRIFKCIDIGGGEQRVEIDINTVCWSSTHLKWIFSLGMPMAIIYSISLPICALTILVKNRDRLSDPNVLQYYILLYQGLNHNIYYWELINTCRKSSLLLLQAFIPRTYTATKILIGSSLIFCLSVIQARQKPFKIGIISSLEHREMVASIVTLFSGLIFIQTDNREIFSIIVFTIVVVVNVRFYLLWFIVAVTIYRKYKVLNLVSVWMRRTFCIKMTQEDENKLSYNSKATTDDVVVDETAEKSKKYKKQVRLSDTFRKKSMKQRELDNKYEKTSPKISKVERLTSMLLFKNDGNITKHKKKKMHKKITSKEILDITKNNESIKELFDNSKSSRKKMEFVEFKINKSSNKMKKNKKQKSKRKFEEEKANIFWFDNIEGTSEMESTPHHIVSPKGHKQKYVKEDEDNKFESKAIKLKSKIKELKKDKAFKVFDNLVDHLSEESKN